MAESYPSDADLNALSGTQDAEQEILAPTANLDPWGTEWYKFFYRLLLTARRAGDLRVYKDAALTYGVRAGKYFNGDTLVSYAGSTGNALTNNATNYIYLLADGTLSINTTGFPIPSVTPHIRLAVITTSAGTYAPESGHLVDWRGTTFLTVSAGPSELSTFDWQESVADELDFTAAEPAGPSVGDRYINTGSGASSVTGQTVAANDIEEWNGTNWTEITPTEGAATVVEDINEVKVYSGSAWGDFATYLADRSVTDIKRDLVTVEANTAGVGSPNILIGDEARKLLTNEGATALNYHTLPAAAAGLTYSFVVADTDGVRIVAAGGDTIRLGATVSKAAGYIESTDVGSAVILTAINATEWMALSIVGNWTVETS